MDFRSMTVKECFDNPKTVAVIKELAPALMENVEYDAEGNELSRSYEPA